MQQSCNECQKTFSHSAKLTQTIPLTNDKMKARFAEHDELPICDSVEIYVCPYCYSIDIAEAAPQPIEAPQVEAVYIYDLTTGNQEKLNELLANGFLIVNRYSKQYHLEKPKAPASPQATQTPTEAC